MTYAPNTSADEGRESLREALAGLAAEGGAVLLDHSLRNVDELNLETILLAVEGGWRGADAQDFRGIRRLITVAQGNTEPSFYYLGADEMAISENLGWVADDAESYICELCPEGWYVANDGHAGAFVLQRTDDLRACDGCGLIEDAGTYPDQDGLGRSECCAE